MVLPLLSKGQNPSYQLETEEDVENIPIHEISVSLGYFRSFEKNLFNNPDKVPLTNGFGFGLTYRFPVNPQFKLGFGFNIISAGTASDIPSYATDLLVNLLQVGVNGRWHAADHKKIDPYITFGTYYLFGDMVDELDGISLNTHSGYAIQAGLGVEYHLQETFLLFAEFDTYYGRARWNFLPANDSSDRDLNPGGFTICLGIHLQFSSF